MSALLCPSVHISIRQSTWNNTVPTGWIFKKFDYFSKICTENSIFIKIWQEWRVLYMKLCMHFLSCLAQFFLEWKIFWQSCRENQNTLFKFHKCFWNSCHLWENVENAEQGRLQITIWSMRIALWILKAKNTLTECVILVALPLQP